MLRDLLMDAFDLAMDVLPVIAAGLAVVLVVFGVVCGVFGIVTVWDRVDCHQAGHRLDVEVRYDFPSGCYYRIDGRWVPSGAYWFPAKPIR